MNAHRRSNHFSWTVSARKMCAGFVCLSAWGCSVPVEMGQFPETEAGDSSLHADPDASVPVEPSVPAESNPNEGGNEGGAVGYGSGDLTVLMIVDRSGSMAEAWEGGSKWEVARNALDAAIVGVETTQTLGALFFPDESGGCAVAPLSDPSQIQFQRADGFQQRWVHDTITPEGGTPLGEAFRQADIAIAEAETKGLLERRFRVVLISDGQPTCYEDEREIVKMADGWRERGIEVEVLGLPGSAAAAELLDAIAGKVALPGEPDAPPETIWTPDAVDDGYVAPSNQDELDDSVHSIIR